MVHRNSAIQTINIHVRERKGIRGDIERAWLNRWRYESSASRWNAGGGKVYRVVLSKDTAGWSSPFDMVSKIFQSIHLHNLHGNGCLWFFCLCFLFLLEDALEFVIWECRMRLLKDFSIDVL